MCFRAKNAAKSSKSQSRASSPKLSASEKLKQDVLSIIRKNEAEGVTVVDLDGDEKPSTAKLNEIDSGAFKQQSFKSSYNKAKTNTKSSTSSELSTLNPTLAAMNSARYRKKKDMPELSVFDDKLFIDEEEKLNLWMKKLTDYRKEFFHERKPVTGDL